MVTQTGAGKKFFKCILQLWYINHKTKIPPIYTLTVIGKTYFHFNVSLIPSNGLIKCNIESQSCGISRVKFWVVSNFEKNLPVRIRLELVQRKKLFYNEAWPGPIPVELILCCRTPR